MRIIAGTWRSRRLLRPTTDGTRPLPDRFKEAIFNIVGSRFGDCGVLPALRVADVFAGSGSFGLEALSRGAASCVFFERGESALTSLRRNMETLGAGVRGEIVTGDAWVQASRVRDARPFDLVFLDPPYDDTRDSSASGLVIRFLKRVAGSVSETPLIVLHHPAGVRFSPPADDPWEVVDQRTIGSNGVTFFAR